MMNLVPVAPRGARSLSDASSPALSYLSRLGSAESRRVQRCALERLADVLWGEGADFTTAPWHLVRYEVAQAARAKLDVLAPRTINRHLAALRGVLKECWRLGLMSAEDYQRARDVSPAKGFRLPAGREVPAPERAELLDGCSEAQTQVMEVRDRALLATLYLSGVRRSEATMMRIEDVDLRTGRIRVTGKGAKEREVWLPPEGRALVRAWLDLRGHAPGPLFLACTPQGRIHGDARGLGGAAVAQVVRRAAERVGAAHLSPHDLRRTWVGDLLSSGADLSTAQRLAGHASPSTTAAYDRRPSAVGREAVERLRLGR